MNKLVFFLYDTENYEEEEKLAENLSSLVPRRNELVTLKKITYKVINIEYHFIETTFIKDSLQEVHIFLEKI